MNPEKMRMAAYFNPTGHHAAAWRHPRTQKDAPTNFQHYIDIARTAEKAKFDMVFLADSLATRDAHIDAISRSSPQFVVHFEPFTLLSALASQTERIGLVGTASTTYYEPYHIARKFASLDWISNGRAGWNLVTSVQEAEAANFGRAGVESHAVRYERAREFAQTVKGLWDSWDDDAFVMDTESGLYFDPDKMHGLNHQGKHFAVRGPLNIPRSPQGHPVIVQAGASDDGKETAAMFADAIFSPHVTLEAAKDYYDDVKKRMEKYGRGADEAKILPGLSVVVAETDAQAEADFNRLQDLIDPAIGREMLGTMLGEIDLSAYDLDQELPDPLPEPTRGSRGHFDSIMAAARTEKLTIRQLGQRVAGARGKNTIYGSPTTVADYMQSWFEAGACDGFCIMPPYLPGMLDDFCGLVVPELQRRGLFRTEYEGSTLRQNLGLPEVSSRYVNRLS